MFKKRFTRHSFSLKNSGGFTLIEVLIVASVTVLITGFLISNFSRSRLAVDLAASQVLAQVREAQTRAVSGVKYKSSSDISSKHRCGYGVTGNTARDFFMYTSPDASDPLNPDCTVQNRNYDAGTDVPMQTFTLSDTRVEFKNSWAPFGIFRPVFFEPPDPKTYVNNSSAATATPSTILIGPVSTDCAFDPNGCRAVCVYTSGRVEIVTGTACP